MWNRRLIDKKVVLLGLIGAAILASPLLVVQLKFKSSRISRQVHAWSLWLSITWASSCLTYIVVDAIPSLIIYIIIFLNLHAEQLKTQLEVCDSSVVMSTLIFMFDLKNLVDSRCQWMDKTCIGYIMGLDYSWSYPSFLQARRGLLGQH